MQLCKAHGERWPGAQNLLSPWAITDTFFFPFCSPRLDYSEIFPQITVMCISIPSYFSSLFKDENLAFPQFWALHCHQHVPVLVMKDYAFSQTTTMSCIGQLGVYLPWYLHYHNLLSGCLPHSTLQGFADEKELCPAWSRQVVETTWVRNPSVFPNLMFSWLCHWFTLYLHERRFILYILYFETLWVLLSIKSL